MDTDLLQAHAIKKSREFLYSHPEYRPTFWERWRLKYFLFLRQKGYSVAAITGHKEFYGLDFYVNKNVLIPRPETELMVAQALEEIKNPTPCPSPIRGGIKGGVVLIDVGTGSGCITISILKNLPAPIPTYATDISGRALKVAKKNAKKHGVKINFLRGNLLEPILKRTSDFGLQASEKIVITANLPYLTKQQFDSEPSIQREPKNALVADRNGLALYEELLKQIKLLTLDFGLWTSAFLEIDPSQSSAITELVKKYFPQAVVEIQKDLAGRDRLVKITMSC